MARRVYTMQLKCNVPGCTERTGFHEFTTRRDYAEAAQRYAKRPYRCTRHTRPDEVLSDSNAELTTVLVASTSTRYPTLTDLFWHPEDNPAAPLASGYSYGPGFKAYAKDFPPGTRLVITARIELPEESR